MRRLFERGRVRRGRAPRGDGGRAPVAAVDPLHYEDVNVRGTLILLEEIRKRGIRFVFASSSSVYGANEKTCRSARPTTSTTRSRRTRRPSARASCTASRFHHLYGIPTTCLRFFTVYGPRQRPEMAIHKFVRHGARRASRSRSSATARRAATTPTSTTSSTASCARSTAARATRSTTSASRSTTSLSRAGRARRRGLRRRAGPGPSSRCSRGTSIDHLRGRLEGPGEAGLRPVHDAVAEGLERFVGLVPRAERAPEAPD